MTHKLLVGGIGNIFLGDDAFGVEVVRQLAQRPQPAAVRLVDFGIRGVDLTYALLDEYQHAILIDAAPRGGLAGDLYVIEPNLAELDVAAGPPPSLEMHNLDPLRVLRLVKYLGGALPSLTVVGCEPAAARSDDMEAGLSPAVAAMIEPAVLLVERLIRERLSAEPSPDIPDRSPARSV